MTNQAQSSDDAVYYDTYRQDFVRDPYPVYRRLRDEAPVYFNEQFNFYAVSRYDDVRQGLFDHQTFSSARGDILEIVLQQIEVPRGTFIMEDPPVHTMHRNAVARLFTPRRMNGLEEKVRAITAQCMDRLVGRDEFDFIADIGAQIPMRVIGELLGIPESDFEVVRESVDARMRTDGDNPIEYADGSVQIDQNFGAYIDWREKNPSDDVITELLNVEFDDETGARRKLSKDEILIFINILAGAGNETTNKLIGWTGKTLWEYPDQRRELAENPALIPEAVEELLRYEPPGPHMARYVMRDVELHGRTIPAGSAILFIIASANRDERKFPNPDHFDIHRDRAPHMSFGYGIHTCVGNVLARMEGRVVIEELLRRFPTWEVDMARAKLLPTSTVRGWETLPALVR